MRNNKSEEKPKEQQEAIPADLQQWYKDWCKETKRSGGILIGSSVREFIDYVSGKLTEAEADCYCDKSGIQDKHSCGWYNYDNLCTRKKGDPADKSISYAPERMAAPATEEGEAKDLPDDLLHWVRAAEDNYSHQHSDQKAYRAGATDMFWQHLSKDENPYRASFVKFAHSCTEDRNRLKDELSAIKEESKQYGFLLDRVWESAFEYLPDDIRAKVKEVYIKNMGIV